LTQAAQQTGIPRGRIRGWIVGGHLPAHFIGRLLYLHPADLAAAQEAAPWRLVEPRWRRNPPRAGQRLRLLREAAGLNQQQLAARSGLTHEEISRLEHGQQTPLRGTVRQLAQALNVAPTV